MMKTPNLIDVLRDHPTKRERIKAFKAKHEIETHRANGDEWPWMAGHLPSCRKLGYGCTETSDLCECASHVGRLMDEAGYVAYSKSEVGAIRELCDNLDILCDL